MEKVYRLVWQHAHSVVVSRAAHEVDRLIGLRVYRFIGLLVIALLTPNSSRLTAELLAQSAPKREFRGAWIQCVNGQYLGKTPAQLRAMLSSQLDVLESAGINAIIFQVRAEGDALYKSKYEPWSRYLTGQQGLAPEDGWDPLEWMVGQCHSRGMECHAWINPYRAKTKGTTALATNHAAVKYPSRVFRYGDLLIFDPAQEVNRQYTCMIIEDILTRYDVDGLHMDDYFYPYPEAGQEIPDDGDANKRRENVNSLIEDIYHTCRRVKPWVKFGISPFGIYHNNPAGINSKEGSATNGLQNYDQLYADVVLWQQKGWVDYLIPQIYWNIGNRAADYAVLCEWWSNFCGGRPLYVGQDIERTLKENQTERKYTIQRFLRNIKGSCQWYAAAVVNNPDYLHDLQTKWHATPALQPSMPWIDDTPPGKVKGLKVQVVQGVQGTQGGIYLTWKAPKAKKEMDRAVQYAVYRFSKGEKIDIDASDAAQHLVGVVSDTRYRLVGNQSGYVFVVTALDRLHNESKIKKIKL